MAISQKCHSATWFASTLMSFKHFNSIMRYLGFNKGCVSICFETFSICSWLCFKGAHDLHMWWRYLTKTKHWTDIFQNNRFTKIIKMLIFDWQTAWLGIRFPLHFKTSYFLDLMWYTIAGHEYNENELSQCIAFSNFPLKSWFNIYSMPYSPILRIGS